MSQLLSVSSMRRYFSIQVLVLHRIIEKRYVLLMRLKKLLSWKINMKTKMDLLIKLSRIHIKRMARFLSTPWHSRMMSPELTTNYQKVATHQAARVSATQNNKMDNKRQKWENFEKSIKRKKTFFAIWKFFMPEFFLCQA